MPHAVLLYFDMTTDAHVRAVWERLAEAGVAPYMQTSGIRPHVTLRGSEDWNTEGEGRLRTLAAATPPLPVVLNHLGIFVQEPVVFVEPLVTPDLIEFRRR